MGNIENDKFYSVAILALIGAIIASALLTAFNIFIQQPQMRDLSATTLSSGEAMVVIDYGNGKSRIFKGPAGENANIFGLFQQAAVVGKFGFEISDHFIPQEIDGVKSGIAGKRWDVYLNGVKQQSDLLSVQANPGDKVLFKFE